jgi:NTE family protein
MSAGGPAGAAWIFGFLHASLHDGVDLGRADLVVGTSAGALAGAAFRAGLLDETVLRYRRSELPWFEYPATLDDYMAAATRAGDGAPSHTEAVRRVANLEPLGSELVPVDSMRAVVEVHLPLEGWPPGRLELTAVDADTGHRMVFDARSGVDLHDAVTASCTSPGMAQLVPINGRRYADGGVHSPCNVDLAAGSDDVIVLVPLSIPDLEEKLDAEIEALGGANVYVTAADEASLDAMGANALSMETLQEALDAGAMQCRRQIDELRSFWNAGSA